MNKKFAEQPLNVNHCRINVRNHVSANVSLEFGTVYRRALLVLSHYFFHLQQLTM